MLKTVQGRKKSESIEKESWNEIHFLSRKKKRKNQQKQLEWCTINRKHTFWINVALGESPLSKWFKRKCIKLLVEFGKETKIIFIGKWKSFSFNEKSNTSEFIFQVLITINRHNNNNSSTVVDLFLKKALFKGNEVSCYVQCKNIVRIIAKYR